MEAKRIGAKITNARKGKQLSQAQLAEQLFISPQAVGKWERGESLPDIITLIRMTQVLDIDLNYFSDLHSSDELIVQQHETIIEETIEKPKLDMSKGNWVDGNFTGLKNLTEKFSSSNLQRCNFSKSELSGLMLSGNNITECNFNESDINKSLIKRSNLEKNQFVASSLNGTEFTGSYISGCDFSGADFSAASIKSGGFEKNILTNVVLKSTSFISSHLANLEFNSNLEDCYFEACTFKNVLFKGVTLRNCFFKNNNLKKVKFDNCFADRITYEFLKHGKANLDGLQLIQD